MKPGVSHRLIDRQAVAVAELEETRGFVRRRRIDRPAQMGRVVGDQPRRTALDADQGGDHAGGEAAPQFEHAAGVGQDASITARMS